MPRSSHSLCGGGSDICSWRTKVRTADASGPRVDLEVGFGPTLLAIVGDVDDHTRECRVCREREASQGRAARGSELDMHTGRLESACVDERVVHRQSPKEIAHEITGEIAGGRCVIRSACTLIFTRHSS